MKKLILLLLILSSPIFSQTMTYDDFLDVAKKSLNVAALKELRIILPKDFTVTALDIGDFSGDGKNDFGLAIKPSRSNRAIYVYLFCDSLGSYALVHSDTLDFVELPIEIGFSISNQTCFLTHKIKDKNWSITGYSYIRNELAVTDHYNTDVRSIKRNLIGKEVYNNYQTLHSFEGYYDINTLNEIRKSYFLSHPVYERKRNIYNSFVRSSVINESWRWDDADTSVKMEYGRISFSREAGSLIIDLRLHEQFAKTLDSSSLQNISLFFDRTIKRSPGYSRRIPEFRDKPDEETGSIDLTWSNIRPDSSELHANWGKSYNHEGKDDIRYYLNNEDDINYRLELPVSLFNSDSMRNEAGIFIKLDLSLKNNTRLLLTNSNGRSDDPFSYGRLIFLGDGEYYGSVGNAKFKRLIRKIMDNGFINTGNP